MEYGDMTSEMIRDRIVVQPKGHLEEVRAGNTAKRSQKGKATGGKNKPKGSKGTPTPVCMRCGKGSHPWGKYPGNLPKVQEERQW